MDEAFFPWVRVVALFGSVVFLSGAQLLAHRAQLLPLGLLPTSENLTTLTAAVLRLSVDLDLPQCNEAGPPPPTEPHMITPVRRHAAC